MESLSFLNGLLCLVSELAEIFYYDLPPWDELLIAFARHLGISALHILIYNQVVRLLGGRLESKANRFAKLKRKRGRRYPLAARRMRLRKKAVQMRGQGDTADMWQVIAQPDQTHKQRRLPKHELPTRIPKKTGKLLKVAPEEDKVYRIISFKRPEPKKSTDNVTNCSSSRQKHKKISFMTPMTPPNTPAVQNPLEEVVGLAKARPEALPKPKRVGWMNSQNPEFEVFYNPVRVTNLRTEKSVHSPTGAKPKI